MKSVGFAVLALGAVFSLRTASAAEDVRTARVTFARGASSTSIHDSIKGDQSVNYELGAASGQTMVVSLTSANTSTYFNVFAPGKVPGRDEAMFIGASSGNRFEGQLSAAGTCIHPSLSLPQRRAPRRGR